ncbi:MAG: hypothetical protein LLF94_09580, partial [Chlamydiales bacterium]|nr:hypothetical protein [Chlamydiales bacterium]
KVSPLTYVDAHHDLVKGLHKRFFAWNYYVEGDYLWTALNTHEPDDAWKNAIRRAQSFEKHYGVGMVVKGVFLAFGRSIRALWHVVLERSCS